MAYSVRWRVRTGVGHASPFNSSPTSAVATTSILFTAIYIADIAKSSLQVCKFDVRREFDALLDGRWVG
jgi:hypothetical protein